jgi:phytoene dehydrogenase-like protein
MYGEWRRIGNDVVHALLEPFPPLEAGAALATRLNRELLRFVRFTLLPVRRLAEEHLCGPAAAMLLAGNALHADLSPEAPLSGFFGWLLCCLGQQYGFPVPEGGAAQLTAAMVRRFRSRGGEVTCSMSVDGIVIRNGRAVGVHTADGDTIAVRLGGHR